MAGDGTALTGAALPDLDRNAAAAPEACVEITTGPAPYEIFVERCAGVPGDNLREHRCCFMIAMRLASPCDGKRADMAPPAKCDQPPGRTLMPCRARQPWGRVRPPQSKRRSRDAERVERAARLSRPCFGQLPARPAGGAPMRSVAIRQEGDVHHAAGIENRRDQAAGAKAFVIRMRSEDQPGPAQGRVAPVDRAGSQDQPPPCRRTGRYHQRSSPQRSVSSQDATARSRA